MTTSGGAATNGQGSGEPTLGALRPTYGNGSANGHSGADGNAAHDSNSTNGQTNGAAEERTSDTVMDDDSNHVFAPLYDGSHLDKREFIRLTLQSLRELGFESSAKSLETESGVTLEHASIIAFRQAILSGDWKNAERLLLDGLKYGASRVAARSAGVASSSRHPVLGSTSSSSSDLDLVLRDPQSRGLDSIKFLIYQQRYLELLESKQTRKALSVLRDRLAPLNHGSDRLHQLSSLVICSTPEELRSRANWLGSGTASRRWLLGEIESAVSPAVMIPSRRLPQLLEQAQQLQKSRDPFFNLPSDTRISLYIDHQSDRSVFPTHTAAILTAHTDEVWHVAFSHDGSRMGSVGKDRQVLVWTVGTSQSEFEVLHRFGPMNGAVCHAAFSGDDKSLLTTSDDGEVAVWNLDNGDKMECSGHTYTVASGSWLPDGGFVTGGMDRKVIFWNSDASRRHVWSTAPFRVQALDVSPDGRYLVAVSHRYVQSTASAGTGANATTTTPNRSGTAVIPGSSMRAAWTAMESPTPAFNDEEYWALAAAEAGGTGNVIDLGGGSRTLGEERFQIHFYDVQQQEELGSIYMWDEMTSVTFSDDSRHVLINQRPNDAQVWDVQRQSLVHRFSGHRIQQHVIRSCFGGAGKAFVISGSEDGRIYVYHRESGKLLERLGGHGKGSVNSVGWHPRQHNMFASCSDDGTIRIWRPAPGSAGTFSGGAGGIGNGVHSSNGHGAASDPFGTLTSSEGVRHAIGGDLDIGASSNGQGSMTVSSDTMGPSPFPWATSPREPRSPTTNTTQRRNRRRAAAQAAENVASSAAGTAGRSHDDDDEEDDDEEDEVDEDDEDDEEGDEDDDEDDEDEDAAMEEGGP